LGNPVIFQCNKQDVWATLSSASNKQVLWVTLSYAKINKICGPPCNLPAINKFFGSPCHLPVQLTRFVGHPVIYTSNKQDLTVTLSTAINKQDLWATLSSASNKQVFIGNPLICKQ